MHPSGVSMLIMGEAVGGGAGVYGKSFPPAQFFCEPNTILRNKTKFLKNRNQLIHLNLMSGSWVAVRMGEQWLLKQLRHLSSYETPLTTAEIGSEENRAQRRELFPFLRENQQGNKNKLGVKLPDVTSLSVPWAS